MEQRHTTIEREKLYDEVWSSPMKKIAESYSMSGNDIKRAAYAMGVPLPSSGHWAKVAHGKAEPRPALHEGEYPTTYKHAVWFNEDAEEVQRRLDALLADRYERAARLRRFANVLDESGCIDPSKAQPALNWLRNAAEWLDPTVRRHWPAVDDVEGAPSYE